MLCQLTVAHSLSPTYPKTRVRLHNSNRPPSGPSSNLPSYSYDAALHHAKVKSPPDPSRLPSHLPPPTAHSLETDIPAGVADSNIAEGNYGDPSDKLFSVYLAQADQFDKEQSEGWKGDTEGILVFVCRRTIP